MEAFASSGSAMVVILVAVALGYLVRKLNYVDDDFDSKLSKIVMTVACPALVIDSVLSNTDLPDSIVIWQVLGVSVILFAVALVLALIVPRLYPLPKEKRGGHAFTILMSNVGFMGFAVCDAIMGSDSVLYVAIYNIISNLVLFSIGAWMVSSTGTASLSRKEQLTTMRKNLLSPVMIACIASLVLALLHVTDDGVVGQTFDFVGSMTAPAAMIVIGSTLAKYKVRDMLGNGWAYVTTFVRLIIVPAAVYAVGSLFIADAYLLATLTLVAAMPAAMVGVIMGVTYGGDLKTLSQCMFLTTVLSVLTIPLVAAVVL